MTKVERGKEKNYHFGKDETRQGREEKDSYRVGDKRNREVGLYHVFYYLL